MVPLPIRFTARKDGDLRSGCVLGRETTHPFHGGHRRHDQDEGTAGTTKMRANIFPTGGKLALIAGNKTEKKTSGKRSGWKEAEGKVSEQKWEDRLYENLSQTVERNQQTNQSQPVNGQKMSDCGQKTSESSRIHMDYGETVVLSAGTVSGPASLVSKEPGELATIYLNEDLTVIGKLETACDAVISLPTVSRIHAKIRKKEENYFLSDMNSRNGTSVNGRLLRPDEEYQLEPEDEVDFAQARYIFLE